MHFVWLVQWSAELSKCHDWNDLVETSNSSCLVICSRAFGVAAMVLVVSENEIQASCFFVSFSSARIVQVATLHIAFSWLPLPIGQVCSQAWCRPYLAAHFGVFDLRTFPWSLSQVQVSTLYPFTPKVASKCTYVILTSSSVQPSINKSGLMHQDLMSFLSYNKKCKDCIFLVKQNSFSNVKLFERNSNLEKI